MSTHENSRLIEDLYRTFQRGDVPGVLNFLHQEADLVFEGPATIPWAGIRRGRDGWLKFFESLGENIDEVAVQMQVFATDGDRVVAAGRYQARVRKTGRRIDSPLVHLWTLRDGKVVHCLEMTNTAVEVEALV